MSKEYNDYLNAHISNVNKAYEWIQDNIPEILENESNFDMNLSTMIADHDKSKCEQDEYGPYDQYFYGKGLYKMQGKCLEEFRKANLIHIHRNPHHWQYWILSEDSHGHSRTAIDMPYNYIIEMICDWWSFGFMNDNLYDLFTWWDEHKTNIIISEKTAYSVEMIINKIREKLTEQDKMFVKYDNSVNKSF